MHRMQVLPFQIFGELQNQPGFLGTALKPPLPGNPKLRQAAMGDPLAPPCQPVSVKE
jgi:hypothetical protein